mgnify:CR=1 FL=1
MFRAPKSNPQTTWMPSANKKLLQHRADLLHQIRNFFASRDVLEVETPLLCQASVTDPYIESIEAKMHDGDASYFLQTSPEYAMKRLLAAGSGSIYQISKAFRSGECGRFHNPEFTMIEWYRIGFDHHQLMDEVDELLQTTLQTSKAKRLSYAELFQQYLNVNPHMADCATLSAIASAHHIEVAAQIEDRDTWLEVLMSQVIEPQLDLKIPFFVYDFPATQAALARILPGNPPVAARFEVYMSGMELANGFFELNDSSEQRQRFETNIMKRKQLKRRTMPMDEYFLAALQSGLPDCAGVALGFDRLMMLVHDANHIAEVLTFDFSRV